MHRPQHSSPSAAHSDNDRFLLVFLKKLPQRFVCSICTGVFTDPVSLRNCGHHFCNKCIIEWVRSSQHCATCRAVAHVSDVRKAHFVDECIEDLEVTCPRGVVAKAGHTGNGVLGEDFDRRDGACAAVLPVKDMKRHAQQCKESTDIARYTTVIKELNDMLENAQRELEEKEDELEELHSRFDTLEASYSDLSQELATSKARAGFPEFRKCDCTELELLGKMLAGMLGRFVPSKTRDTIFSNIVSIHKDYVAGVMVSEFRNHLRMVVAIAMDLAANWPQLQWDRLWQIMRDL